jgi:hypothetical protein
MQVNLAVLRDTADVSREGTLDILGEFDSIHASLPLPFVATADADLDHDLDGPA